MKRPERRIEKLDPDDERSVRYHARSMVEHARKARRQRLQPQERQMVEAAREMLARDVHRKKAKRKKKQVRSSKRTNR